jgi:hypothetical protein
VDEKRVRQFNLEYGIASDRTATRDWLSVGFSPLRFHSKQITNVQSTFQ